MKKEPLITIGITCFNASSTIERALKSAINQSWSNLEIIIVNDCSTDNTIDIIKKFRKKFKIIRIFNNKINLGCAQSRNKIISHSRGEFIAFFDADDFSLNERLRLQYQRIIKYEKKSKSRFIACYTSGKKFIQMDILKILMLWGL